jgi:GR25 family glycosyltransferase involved in LPS biosynthesis
MINIAIAGHTSRLNNITTLAELVDPNYISIDDGTIGCTNNHKLVLNWHRNRHSGWSVILEDDCLPVNNFRHQLQQALDAAPTPIVSLYLGRKRPQEFQDHIAAALKHAHNTNAHWITAPNMMHAVGYAIHTTHIPDLLDDLNTPRFNPQPIDHNISQWAHNRHHQIAYCIPSLINHDDTLPVVAEHDGPRPPGRTAWTVGTREHWNSESVIL